MEQRQVEISTRKGGEIGRSYIIRIGQRFSIGRSPDCAISLDDPMISRNHAYLEFTKEGLVVCDLGSINGSYLDGKRLQENQPIVTTSGNLRMGDHVLSAEIYGLDAQVRSSMMQTRRLPRNIVPPDEFEILGVIGQGATGVVYAAHQKGLDRNVAIKFPRNDVSNYDECRARFIREGQLCCRIESPYVVNTFDMRLYGDRVFIVMELVNGGSVHDRLRSSTIPINEIARIGENIASALAATHRLGIIHRDLKPSNILLTPGGVAKLADFGIAKFLKEEEDTKGGRLTGSGEGMGTLGYVSPEGATCEQLGSFSDIYSLGATLYHMLTNRAPFVWPDAPMATVLERIIACPPDPIEDYRPDCPEELSQLVMSMLEKHPEDRPADAFVVASRLDYIKSKYNTAFNRLLPQTEEFFVRGFQAESQTDRIGTS